MVLVYHKGPKWRTSLVLTDQHTWNVCVPEALCAAGWTAASYHCRLDTSIACGFTLTSQQWLFVDFSRPLPFLADLITIWADARNRLKRIVSEFFSCESLTFGPIWRLLDTLVWGNSTFKAIFGMRLIIINRTQLPFAVMIKLIDSTMANKPSFQSRCLVIFYIWSHSGFEPAENIQLANLVEAGCQICCTKVCIPQGNMSNLRSHLWTWQQSEWRHIRLWSTGSRTDSWESRRLSSGKLCRRTSRTATEWALLWTVWLTVWSRKWHHFTQMSSRDASVSVRHLLLLLLSW